MTSTTEIVPSAINLIVPAPQLSAELIVKAPASSEPPEGSDLTSVFLDNLEANASNVLELEDGSAVVGEIEEDAALALDAPFDANLADYLGDSEIGRISSDIMGSIEDDLSSRSDWEDTYTRGLEFLGMQYEERSEPFEGSSGVIHPLLAESVTQFQAQAYRELLPASGPVRTQVVGAQNEMIVKQAERVKDYMNYMITYEMEEYDPELDQMLFYLPVIGSTFKKIYLDRS